MQMRRGRTLSLSISVEHEYSLIAKIFVLIDQYEKMIGLSNEIKMENG